MGVSLFLSLSGHKHGCRQAETVRLLVPMITEASLIGRGFHEGAVGGKEHVDIVSGKPEILRRSRFGCASSYPSGPENSFPSVFAREWHSAFLFRPPAPGGGRQWTVGRVVAAAARFQLPEGPLGRCSFYLALGPLRVDPRLRGGGGA